MRSSVSCSRILTKRRDVLDVFGSSGRAQVPRAPNASHPLED
jgi:hypothetical protein